MNQILALQNLDVEPESGYLCFSSLGWSTHSETL